MTRTELEAALRAELRNDPGEAREVLRDLLLEQGREESMPVLLEDWRWDALQLRKAGKRLPLWNGWEAEMACNNWGWLDGEGWIVRMYAPLESSIPVTSFYGRSDTDVEALLRRFAENPPRQ